jgi:general secretion pathway protein C
MPPANPMSSMTWLRIINASWLPKAVIGLMVLLILREAAVMAYLTHSQRERLASVTQAAPQTRQAAPATDYAGRVAQLYLLGKPNTSTDLSSVNAPPTQLNLHLQGIVAGTKPPVVIVADGQTEAAYVLGDKIAGQAIVKAIYPDHIVLERQGRLETLRLEGVAGEDNLVAPAGAAGAPDNTAPEPDASDFQEETGAQQSGANSQQIDQFFKMAAIQQNGVVHGYQIQPGADEELLKQLGLRPMDVIVEIDNTPVGQATGSPNFLFQKLWQGSPVTLTVERNGQPQRVQVSLDD